MAEVLQMFLSVDYNILNLTSEWPLRCHTTMLSSTQYRPIGQKIKLKSDIMLDKLDR